MAELTREIRDKRVAVMRDVLIQLDRKDVSLNLHRGTYFCGQHNGADFKDGGLEAQVDFLQEHCEVCMIGAAFLSCIRIIGGIHDHAVRRGYTTFYADPFTMRIAMSSVFDSKTLDLIEHAFEGWEDAKEGCKAASIWGDQFYDTRDAARAIATNIISNDGEFILPALVATPA